MSLFDEALIDAKKLKEVAEHDARQAIIEELSPHIRKLITNTLSGKQALLFEEESPSTDSAPMSANPAAISPSGETPAVGAPVAADPTTSGIETPPIPTSGMGDAPIQVSGADGMNMPMPGPDGKLVIDFDQLFVPTEPGSTDASGTEGAASAELAPEVPGGMPSAEPVDVNPLPGPEAEPDSAELPPVTPEPVGDEPQLETYELFSETLESTAKRVQAIFLSEA